MDTPRRIALDTVTANLAVIIRFAEERGLPPDVVLATLLDVGASVYAEGVVASSSKVERKAARKLFHRAVRRMMSGLPSASKDARLEEALKRGGFYDRPG